MKIIESTFDPITANELHALHQLTKQYHDVYIKVKEEGILSKTIRETIVSKAIQPYRHLHLYTGKKQGDCFQQDFLQQEEDVRHGKLYLMERGSRNFVLENGYYFEEIVKYCCNQRRAAHSLSVASTAKKLARMHGLDESLAYRTGLLHDITKKWSDEEGKQLLEIYARDTLAYDPKVWHSFTAPIVLKTEMNLYDTRILKAIWHHTLGDGNSVYDDILYIADKIEPTRGYDASYEWALSKKSLKQAAHYVLQKSKAYILVKEGKHV